MHVIMGDLVFNVKFRSHAVFSSAVYGPNCFIPFGSTMSKQTRPSYSPTFSSDREFFVAKHASPQINWSKMIKASLHPKPTVNVPFCEAEQISDSLIGSGARQLRAKQRMLESSGGAWTDCRHGGAGGWGGGGGLRHREKHTSLFHDTASLNFNALFQCVGACEVACFGCAL